MANGGGTGNNGSDQGSRNLARSMREAQPYIDAVWQFLASVGVMTWLGWWADGRLGTGPWLLLVGALAGFGAGTWAFLKVLLYRRPGGGPPEQKRSNDESTLPK